MGGNYDFGYGSSKPSAFDDFMAKGSYQMQPTTASDMTGGSFDSVGAKTNSTGVAAGPKATGPAMMTGNPYAIGGAMALDAYQQYKARQEQERIMEYESKLNRIRSMQNSLANAAQMAGRVSYT